MNRAQMLEGLDWILDAVKSGNGDPVYFIPRMKDISDEEKMHDEYDSLGFFVSKNPLEDHYIRLKQLSSISDLEGKKEKEKCHIGGIITELKVVTTKKKQEMAIFHVETLDGRIEVVAFPNVYAKRKNLIKKIALVEIKGFLELQTRMINNEEVVRPKIILSYVEPLKKIRKIKNLILCLKERDDFQKICDIIIGNPGEIPVTLKYENMILYTNLKVSQDPNILNKLTTLCHMTET